MVDCLFDNNSNNNNSTTMYATRRRKRNARKSNNTNNNNSNIKQSPVMRVMAPVMSANPGDLLGATAGNLRSNPSKRHRERLNIELECLAELLPFDATIVQKLDKLSILRLASSYLKAKCYLRNAAQSCPDLAEQLPYYFMIDDPIQTMDGFLLIVTTDGELFFASSNVEMYLGFHQSDILHQSVLELIHSEDREMFKEQLEWNHRNARHEALSTPRRTPTHGSDFYLQRSFTARFRCLLDNTSGFVTMDVTGRLQPFPPGFPNSLTGGNNLAVASAGIRTRPSPTSTSNNSGNSHTTNSSSVSPPNGNTAAAAAAASSIPSLALFAYCQPFGPGAFPVAAGQIDLAKTFKSKHSLDFSFISVDPRVRQVIEGADEHDFFQKTFYNIVHLPDLQYVSTAHAELMKRGSCGILAYRIVNPNTSTGGLVWLQTSARIVYRCNKPDTILCIHRRLTDDEGEGLIAKRASEFRLPCALFDAVEAASATSQQKAAAASQPGGETAGLLPPAPEMLEQVSTDSNNSNLTRPPQQFSVDGPGVPAKRVKTTTTTGKQRASKKQKQVLASEPQPASIIGGNNNTNQDAVSGGLLPQIVPRIEGIWPSSSTPCYNNGAYSASGYYSSTAEQQFGNLAQQQFATNNQQQPYNNMTTSDCLQPYYSGYGNYAGHQYEEFGSGVGGNPCLYGVGNSGSNLATLANSWNASSFMANSEKLLSQYGYRLMYDQQATSVALVGGQADQQSPDHSSIGGATSDESPQTTSVIRHTSFGSNNNNSNAAYQQQYPGYVTPIPQNVVASSNHPAMFQAQPLYAATPASQFMS